MTKNLFPPPKHLSRESKKTWDMLIDEYGIFDMAGRRILTVSLEAFDRAQKSRRRIERDGMCIKDRFGVLKPHPLLPVERDNRAAFLAGLKALNLDLEPLRDRRR